ncbi:MAG: bifunctional nuclease family protein [Anaerolineales bacterium]|nr:bifunctional nuclease family protein [Anaerolineales bacterium]
MSEMVEVVIDSIRVGLMSQSRVVILKEVNADRYLAIWIDSYQAEQITYVLQDIHPARPMTHDLIKSILVSLNARILRVEVTAVRKDIFYGNLVIEINGEIYNIDARPSDALAIAVRTKSPIFIDTEVLETSGIIPEDDITLEETADDFADHTNSSDKDTSDEDLSAFDDFLDNLEI